MKLKIFYISWNYGMMLNQVRNQPNESWNKCCLGHRSMERWSNGITGPVSLKSLRFLDLLITNWCDSFGRLFKLDLSINQLNGWILESLGWLVSLQANFCLLNLVNESIQVSIVQLAKLHSLDIWKNVLWAVIEAYFVTNWNFLYKRRKWRFK